MRALPAVLLATAALAGCARALHEPPPLADLAGGGARAAPEDVETLLERAEVLYARRSLESVREAAQVWLQAAAADAGRVEGLMGAVRARVWLVDHETDPEARRGAATVAVRAAQWCKRIAPASSGCDYWMGAALGVQAQEHRTTALDALPKIVEAFQRAADADPNLEEAGPDRALALVYARAPGWPAGPGDPDQALDHARKAAALAPEYPPNQLALAEALVAHGDKVPSRETYEHALDLARVRSAAGDPDAQEWIHEAEEALRSRSRD